MAFSKVLDQKAVYFPAEQYKTLNELRNVITTAAREHMWRSYAFREGKPIDGQLVDPWAVPLQLLRQAEDMEQALHDQFRVLMTGTEPEESSGQEFNWAEMRQALNRALSKLGPRVSPQPSPQEGHHDTSGSPRE